MGADTFFTRSTGKNAKEAFSKAVQDAKHESGHGGYTGTIAEKSTFVMINDSLDDVKRNILNKMKFAQGTEMQSLELLHDRFVEDDKSSVPELIANTLIDLDDQRISDKWGPAGCIKTETSFLFFGLASS